MAQSSAPRDAGIPVVATSVVASTSIGPAAACAAALAVPLCYLPNLSSVFAEPKLALLSVAGALGIGGQILSWVLAWAQASPARPRLSRALCAAVAALLVTMAISAVAARARGAPGAPYAGLELGRILAVVGIALAAARAAMDDRWRRRLLTSIHVSAGLVSILGLLQHLQILPLPIPTISVPGSTFGNRNIAAEAVALSLPFGLALLALRRRGAGGGQPAPDSLAPILLLLAIEIVYLSATRTRGAWLGAASGIAMFLLLRRRVLPRAAWGLTIALGVAALGAALIPGRMIPRDMDDTKRFDSGEHVVREALDPTSPVVRTRLGLWRRTLAMYRAHPVVGVGPGNFVVFFPLYAEPGASADGVLTPTTVPRRAHQDLLERLAETGPFGLAALLAVYAVGVGIAWRRARRAGQPPPRAAGDPPAAGGARRREEQEAAATIAAAAAGCLAALFACGLTGFPLAMPATALLFGVALGFLAWDPDPDERGDRGDRADGGDRGRGLAVRGGGLAVRAGAWAVAGIIVVGAAVTSGRIVIRCYWLARAEAALRAGSRPGLGAPAALEALRRAERIDPGRFQVALETGFVLVRLGRPAEALAAVDRALAVEPHSANAWALRAEAALGAGDARRAADDARRALALLADYPDALATLAVAQARLGDRVAEAQARARLGALATAGNQRARRLLEAIQSGARTR